MICVLADRQRLALDWGVSRFDLLSFCTCTDTSLDRIAIPSRRDGIAVVTILKLVPMGTCLLVIATSLFLYVFFFKPRLPVPCVA